MRKSRRPPPSVYASIVETLEELLEAELSDAFSRGDDLAGDHFTTAELSDGRSFELLIEWRENALAAAISTLAAALRKRTPQEGSIPLIATRYMPPDVAQHCATEGVGWFDLSGNAHIKAPGLYVHVEGKRNLFKRSGRPENPFAPRSARVARALLAAPGEWTTQKKLTHDTLLSLSSVSHVVRRLDELGLLERQGAHEFRARSSALLRAWAASYDIQKHTIHKAHLYARSGEMLTRDLHQRLVDLDVQHVFTGLAAAAVYAPKAGYRLSSLYLPHLPPLQQLQDVEIRIVEEGWNTWLIVPQDDDVLREPYVTEAGGIPCVEPFQAWLDLGGHPERAQEAADALLQSAHMAGLT